MNLVLVPEVPLLEASRDGDLAEDGLEEDEALHDVVHVGEPRSGGQDDAVGFVVSIHTPPAYLFRGVLVVLEEGGEGGGLVDEVLRPREVASVLEKQRSAVGCAPRAEDGRVLVANVLPAGRLCLRVVVGHGGHVVFADVLDHVAGLLADVLAGGPHDARVGGGPKEGNLVRDQHVVANVLSGWGFPAVHAEGDEGVEVGEVEDIQHLLLRVHVELVEQGVHDCGPARRLVVEIVLHTHKVNKGVRKNAYSPERTRW